MGCAGSKPVGGYEFANAFVGVLKYDNVEEDFGEKGNVFYANTKSMEKFIPYLKANPHLCVLLESHTECPQDRVCTNTSCNRISSVKCDNLIKHFVENGCSNPFSGKSWGCAHPTIGSKNLIRVSLSLPPEPVPEPPREKMLPQQPVHQDQEKIAAIKLELEMAQAALARKESEAQAIRDARQKEQKELDAVRNELELLKATHEQTDVEAELAKLQATEAETQRLANETAAQEIERKKAAFMAAAAEAERRTQAALAAAAEAERKQALAEAATAAAERKRLAFVAAAEAAEVQKREYEAQIESIRRQIEETMKEEIEFVKNKADLTGQGSAICDKVIPFLRKVPDINIYIESHTNCQKGKCDDFCHLMDLSQERVDTVRKYFKDCGCKNNFITKGWGCKHPEYKNVRLVRIFPEHSHKQEVVDQ